MAGMIWAVSDRSGYLPSGQMPGSAPQAATPAAGGAIAVVSPPASSSPEAEIGTRIFDVACASCHGTNAAGQSGKGPPLVHPIHETSHHADIAFATAVRNGVRAHHWEFGAMPSVDERLTDGEISYVVRHVRELQLANGIE